MNVNWEILAITEQLVSTNAEHLNVLAKKDTEERCADLVGDVLHSAIIMI